MKISLRLFNERDEGKNLAVPLFLFLRTTHVLTYIIL